MTELRVTPPGEDGFEKEPRSTGNLYQRAQDAAVPASAARDDQQPDEEPINFLTLVGQAEQQGGRYQKDKLTSTWDRSYRAFQNKHFATSKYLSKDFKGRSRLFRPKTRSAIRKANAAAAAALFSTSDAVKCSPGDEGNPQQRASAALIQELLNYRTDRTSGMASIPWFRLAIGAHQDTQIMSACLSKQYWKLELEKEIVEEPVMLNGQHLLDDVTGKPAVKEVEVWKPRIDRPDSVLIPLENVIIDPAADWLNPVQSATYFIVKYPMRMDEIRQRQEDPRNPWHVVDEATLRGTRTDQKMQEAGVRYARDNGTDRMDPMNTGSGEFSIIWVYEVFMRIGGEDVCFYSAGSKALLTDPMPVKFVYPEQGGERPYTFGVSTLESHRIFPMAPAEAWQPLQQEINDLANLRLDQVKMGVSPIAFVKRGRQVDLNALQRRGPNTTILRTDENDIEFDRPPEVPSSAYAEMERLNVDFDDLAGQFNSGSVQTNRSLNETVGGLNLIQGAANTVQEFDLRTWVETWVEPTIGQLVKLIQFYESDETILGLCGDRAQLMQKFGLNRITDDLLQQQITVRVDVGLGAANPERRLQKLAGAIQILTPLWQASPQVQSGEVMLNIEEMSNEVFGQAGYRDGGKRFIIKGKPRGPNPQQQGMLEKLMSEVEKNRSTAKLNNAKAGETTARVQLDMADMIHGHHKDRAEMVHSARMDREKLARDRDNDQTNQENVVAEREQRAAEAEAPEREPDQNEDMLSQLVALLQQKQQGRTFKFQRGPDGRINGATEVPADQGAQQ